MLSRPMFEAAAHCVRIDTQGAPGFDADASPRRNVIAGPVEQVAGPNTNVRHQASMHTLGPQQGAKTHDGLAAPG